MVALSAAAAKCASTTPWLPWLPWLQLSGTMKQMMLHLTMWWHKAFSLLVGSVVSVATSGAQHLIRGSAEQLAAHNAQKQMQKAARRSSSQPLQSARTLQ